MPKWLARIAMTALAGSHALAGAPAWPVSFSDASSQSLIALHQSLLAPRLDKVPGIPVHDLVWDIDAIVIRIKTGVVFVEPPVDDAPFGAFFVGEATASFKPAADEQRRRLEFWFGRPALEDEPVTEAYFFTLRAHDFASQLSISDPPSVPPDPASGYPEAKAALARRGLDVVEAFMNRSGRAKGTAFVILNAPGIRVEHSKSALLMLRYDPTQQDEIGIEAYGHTTLAQDAPHQFLFHPLATQQAAVPRYRAPAGDVSYGIDLSLGEAMDSAVETTTITLHPAAGVRTLRFRLTPWLQVESVRGDGDRELPFVQWKRSSSGDDLDDSVLVDLGGSPPAGGVTTLRIKATGSLFEPWGDGFWLVDEDAWYPTLPEVRLADYSLHVELPSSRVAVAPGRLVDSKDDGEKRSYTFKTTRPQSSSSIYIGKFQTKAADADGVKIEVYGDRQEKNLDFAAVEMQNIMKVYDRLFFPLKLDTLRVAGAPIDHGRGFDGLLLLSEDAGFSGDSSMADLFRAHEAAHQWWGDLVQPDRWPRDRWLEESFAQYAGMEYYRARFEDVKKTREAIFREWIVPLQRSPKVGTQNLRGQVRNATIVEHWALLDGHQNVYTKGPMVLQMLRYMSSVQSGGDDKFWEILRTFLKDYSGKLARTEDFIGVSERVLGTDLRWFWSQWLLRTEIPKIRWSKRVEPKDGKWLLTVESEQIDTDFTLLVPVYVHFGGEKVAARPLAMKGKAGKLQVLLPEEPSDVTINDNWEALVEVVP